MPNYCDCELDIDGDREVLEKFMEFAHSPERGDKPDKVPGDFKNIDEYMNYLDGLEEHFEETPLDFNNFVPQPKEVLESKESGPMPLWYRWRAVNWGTKWNACSPKVFLRKTKNRLRYNFQTAWAPPKPIIFAMSKKFPSLTFTLRFYEQGMQFQGHLTVKRGGNYTEFEEKEYTGNRGG